MLLGRSSRGSLHDRLARQKKLVDSGKGCWRDNVFVERLWKSVKYEEIYLHSYGTVSDVLQALACYFDFYNCRRPHSTLDGQTPDTAFNQPLLTVAA